MGFSLQCVAKVTVNNLAANCPIFPKQISSLMLARSHSCSSPLCRAENSAIVCDDEITTNYYSIVWEMYDKKTFSSDKFRKFALNFEW
jgi:hypothetical protein